VSDDAYAAGTQTRAAIKDAAMALTDITAAPCDLLKEIDYLFFFFAGFFAAFLAGFFLAFMMIRPSIVNPSW
jgi:hypothetical protein